LPQHLGAILRAVENASEVTVLVTHDHPDHVEGGAELAERLRNSGKLRDHPARPRDGERFETDQAELTAIATPGHTPDHHAFHHPASGSIFCGDLMMGGLDTALVAPPEGDLADYLDSLDRLARLRPRVLYPAHGPPFTDPQAALRRYAQHRAERLNRVLQALHAGRTRLADIADHVYGGVLDPELRFWVESTTLAYLDHLVATGRVEPGDWHDD
jgi:hydroxyacylglutathione hydrolase